jgi:integrase
MRIRLKGINSIRKKLADGTWRTYWYAWKGGPPLRGEPGSPEYIADFNAAVARKVDGSKGTLQGLLDGYQQSTDFLDLRERTKSDYRQKIKQIEERFSDFPIAALADRRSRGVFMEWRDQLALKSRRQADYAWQVLALILQWALDRGTITHNPCARGGRLYQSGVRIEKIWTHEAEAAFVKSAPAYLHLPLLLGLWTAQREGDLLALSWASYDGTHIRLKQSKTGARMIIPVGVPLKAALDATRKQSPLILLNSRGQPWSGHAFQAAFGTAARKAGITGLTFHDLRGSAITRLALAGCSEPEIATLSGHSLRDVRTVLEKFYLHRDPKLAESAIRKLETASNLRKLSQLTPN